MTHEFLVDEGVKKQLDAMIDYMNTYQTNDPKKLADVMEKYQQILQAQTGVGPIDLRPVQKFMNEFEQDLREQIARDSPGVEYGAVLADPDNATDRLKKIQNAKMASTRTGLLSSPLVQGNPDVRDKVTTIVSSMSTIKSKLRFFEHRYVQLNVFLIVFVQHAVTTIQRFIETSMRYTLARDKARNAAVMDLVTKMLDIIGQADFTVDPKDIAALDALVKNVETELKKQQTTLKTSIEREKTQAIDDLLKIIPNSAATAQQSGGALTRAMSAMPLTFYRRDPAVSAARR